MPSSPHPSVDYRNLFVGLEAEIPLLDGSSSKYINFDNAASTPPLKAVQEAVNNFMLYYSSVHRGTGFKSQLSTHAYEEARKAVMQFVGANQDSHTCAFGKNTTEAINKIARRFPFNQDRDMVLTSSMEHHSNDLPWRMVAEVIHANLHPDGRLDMVDFDAKLEEFGNRIAIVAITAGSNVTGFLNPINELAEKAHAVGAQILVDCAQFAPHRQVEMLALNDPKHLDYVVISAHKMYAPYGSGALIGRRDTFEVGDPDMVGGGVVELVSLDDVIWAEPPDREEAGSPNTVGAVALAAAAKQMSAISMQAVAAHEIELTRHALENLSSVPGIQIFGDPNPENAKNRLGVIPFNIEGFNHFHVASILGHEFGIGVRNGCFCAQPLVLHLLKLNPEEISITQDQMMQGNRANMPGMVRASFGLYNTIEEVDMLIGALISIVAGNFKGEYVQDIPTGEYHPIGWEPQFDKYFSLHAEEKT
ncbi:MAG: aminotransferase class V-fold PLP-dependent enzyme [Chloroflexi bacterium]|nr:aminotransferase class V-fold PLP-dependent enzyme [Chloroflexota bacterium]